MILIVTALKAEANELIKRLKLKHKNAPFPLYENDDFVLVICGVGRERCSAAVGWVFGKYTSFDGALNLGCAGSLDNAVKRGTLCLGNIIEASDNPRVYIPDILYEHSLHECKLRTYDHMVSNIDKPEQNVICDMEAYGFAAAVSGFITNDRYVCLKLISDNVYNSVTVTNEDLLELFEESSDAIMTFLYEFAGYCGSCAKENDIEGSDLLSAIAKKYSLTEARKNILKNELHNTLVYYNSVPSLNLLPELEGGEKKHSAKAFDELIYNLKHNINCVCADMDTSNVKAHRRCFRHIYVEEDIADTEYVQNILSKLKSAVVVKVPSYTAVFCRKKQNVRQQAYGKALVLAKARGELLYKGSDYCNAFGFDKFYYCSSVMGCIYDCSYCYLQGLYSSAHITAFVNTEDFFAEIDKVNDGTEMLVCCSYDSDILALEPILGTVDKWLDFAKARPNITLEIRTKSAATMPFDERVPIKNVIIAYTLSPSSAAREYELYTPAPSARLRAAQALASKGWRVRLCLEPVLAPVVNEELYFELADEIAKSSSVYSFEDIVVGGFRMNTPYFKRIAETRPNCKLFANPFLQERNGGMFYEKEQAVTARLAEHIRKNANIDVVCFNNEQ